jgi:N-carbamoyl-L-amino-acid hydrolase
MKIVLHLLLFISCLAQAQNLPKANAARMNERIIELGKYGTNPQGGVTRLAYSDPDKQGRQYIMGLMKAAGLTVIVDAAGNIIGKRSGRISSLPVIAFGSHIDSVPMGGNYDGDVGVIGALECIELLNESRISTDHPLEVIVFTDEEGGLTGSTAMIGGLKDSDLDHVSNSGKTIRQGITDLGGNVSNLASVVRKRGDLAAFLELHIEQGGILHRENLQIGVVEGIVGIEQGEVTVEGKANHAGTTPMDLRKDAMLEASRFVISVNEIVRGEPGNQVGTVGRIKAEPGAPNVIPGKVTLSLELRDLSRDKILSIFQKIRARSDMIAKESGVQFSFRSINSNLPAITDKNIQEAIAVTARSLGFTFKKMPSGAGHDSQDMARVAPTGMIFVPSKDGISHSPFEFTSAQDMANGATVLFHTILKLDKIK